MYYLLLALRLRCRQLRLLRQLLLLLQLLKDGHYTLIKIDVEVATIGVAVALAQEAAESLLLLLLDDLLSNLLSNLLSELLLLLLGKLKLLQREG